MRVVSDELPRSSSYRASELSNPAGFTEKVNSPFTSTTPPKPPFHYIIFLKLCQGFFSWVYLTRN